jgi:hypothetical protein
MQLGMVTGLATVLGILVIWGDEMVISAVSVWSLSQARIVFPSRSNAGSTTRVQVKRAL